MSAILTFMLAHSDLIFDIVSALLTSHAGASVLAAVLPHPSPDAVKALTVARQVIDIVALNVGNATNAQ